MAMRNARVASSAHTTLPAWVGRAPQDEAMDPTISRPRPRGASGGMPVATTGIRKERSATSTSRWASTRRSETVKGLRAWAYAFAASSPTTVSTSVGSTPQPIAVVAANIRAARTALALGANSRVAVTHAFIPRRWECYAGVGQDTEKPRNQTALGGPGRMPGAPTATSQTGMVRTATEERRLSA